MTYWFGQFQDLVWIKLALTCLPFTCQPCKKKYTELFEINESNGKYKKKSVFNWQKNQQKTRCVNQIDEVCKQIEKTIKQTIQNTLNSLEKDTEMIISQINHKLKQDEWDVFCVHNTNFIDSSNFASAYPLIFLEFSETRSMNMNRTLKSTFFIFLSFFLFLITFLSKLPQQTIRSVIGKDASDLIFEYMVYGLSNWNRKKQKKKKIYNFKSFKLSPYTQVGSLLPHDYRSYYFQIVIILGFILLFISKLANK